MDRLTAEERSKTMRRIRSKNTAPEMTVRKLLFSLGYRYRLHPKHLPGKPDLAFPGRKRAIFVHGCFWHQHEGCRDACRPSSNLDYWLPKLERNKVRDRQRIEQLEALGWSCLIVWECELRDIEGVEAKAVAFLGEARRL